MFCKKRCFKKFRKFHRKTPVLESPFIKVAGLRSATQVFPCKICKIFKNTYFVEHLQTSASDDSESDESENDDESYNEGIEAVVRRCSSK